MSQNRGHPLDCPQCQLTDQVQKLSAVVEAGTTQGWFAGPTSGLGVGFGPGGAGLVFVDGWATLGGVQQTELSARLAPPPQPRFEDPWDEFPDRATLWLLAGAIPDAIPIVV